MKRKLTVLLLVAAMVVTGLSGCKAKEAGTKKFKVGITIQSLENSYWAGVFGEVKKMLQEKGWDYTILSCNLSSATQIEQIENFITNGVNLIMVHPADPNAIEDYLKKAREAKIKVMCWDDKMKNTDLNWVLDNTQLGYTIGKACADFVNIHYSQDNKAQIAVMNHPQTPVLLERENGILNALKENAGKLTGDKKLEAEGAVENTAAKVKDAAHDVAEDLKKAAEDVKDAVDGAISGVKNVLHKDDK